VFLERVVDSLVVTLNVVQAISGAALSFGEVGILLGLVLFGFLVPSFRFSVDAIGVESMMFRHVVEIDVADGTTMVRGVSAPKVRLNVLEASTTIKEARVEPQRAFEPFFWSNHEGT
jgi:hypothetical protein